MKGEEEKENVRRRVGNEAREGALRDWVELVEGCLTVSAVRIAS